MASRSLGFFDNAPAGTPAPAAAPDAPDPALGSLLDRRGDPIDQAALGRAMAESGACGRLSFYSDEMLFGWLRADAEWRLKGERRYVLALTEPERGEYLANVARKRGEGAARRLREAVLRGVRDDRFD